MFGKEEGKDKPSKTQTKPRKNPEKKSSTIDARLGSMARCFASSSPTTSPSIGIDGTISRRRDRDLREIAIDGVISRSVDRDLSKHRADRDRRSASQDRNLGSQSSYWSSGFVGDRRTGLELGLLPLARSLSLSLSLFFRKYFEVKMKV